MSSDESTSTDISTFSNRAEKKQQLKEHKSEKWEINLIGDLVLNLYHKSLITAKNEWCIKKSEMRVLFSQFVSEELKQKFKQLNGTDHIGTLLQRCGFLHNTKRSSDMYRINPKALFEYRNNKLKELDSSKVNNDEMQQLVPSDNNTLHKDSKLSLEDDIKIDECSPIKFLEYQGSITQQREENFCPTNMSCFICQTNFSTMDSFEEHVQIHGDDTDFQFLSSLNKFNSPIFTVSYRLCKNSHYFCFEVETSLPDLVIEKIILVQSRSFFYVHNTRVPYKFPTTLVDRLFLDSHLFTIHVEQPIVLICHLPENKQCRIVEQHHFMRSEEFPKVNFAINPYRLPNGKLFAPSFQLADYFPPKEIQDALKGDFYHENLMRTSNEFRDYIRNEMKLQPQTIGASLNILLQIEDIDTLQEYLSLLQKNIKLRSFGDEYSFKVKPKERVFLENVLSAYDELILTTRTNIYANSSELMELTLENKSDIKRMPNTFIGVIQAVNTGRISFKCDQKINKSESYTVIFRPSRLNLRYQYRALQLLPINMNFLRKFLFPTKIDPMPLPNSSINLYNENISNEQLQAVRNIAEGPRIDATYIIFGPPGTGKTTTVVESILQLLKRQETKILVTASSNSACDEVAIRLCKYLNKMDIKRCMVRIYSRSCEIRADQIDDELLENSNMYNGQFYPDVEILHEYRVVVCTLSVVAKLATGKFGRSANGGTVYTHLFIDEVAASTEIEALMAITTVLTTGTRLIISGDHKQLGPILQSKRAKEFGMDVSLMDRLLARDCYRVDVDTGEYDRTIQTRLVRNYRSHASIVKLYSGLYYNHTLQALANQKDVSLCEVWHKSRNKEYPIIFHAIYEPSKADGQSHSLYNFKELEVVMDYVKDLMYFGINGVPVNESDIGIISPYKKQYKLIQEQLNLRKWFRIETGSVEVFQGKEKNIIIVSFVRSGTQSLGFLANPRRLNVTLSRPQSLLILIGNPKTLSTNKDFDYIIKECQRNNTFVGSTARANCVSKKPPSENSGDCSKFQELFSQVNQKMQDLEVQSTGSNGKPKRTRARRNRRRGAGKGKSQNENNDNDNGEGGGKDTRNSKNNEKPQEVNIDTSSSDDDDEDDDVTDESEDEDNDNEPTTSSTALGANTNNSNKKNSKKGNGMGATKKGITGNAGKISKQFGKANQRNNADVNKNIVNKSQLDLLFNELPQVPETSSPQTNVPCQQQFYNNRQQLDQPMMLHANPYYNLLPQNNAYRQPPMTCNPFLYQQMPNYHFSSMPRTAFPTTPNNTNFQYFQNDSNKQNACPNAANNSKSAAAGGGGKVNPQPRVNANSYRVGNNSPRTKNYNSDAPNISKGNRKPNRNHSNERKSKITPKPTNSVNKNQAKETLGTSANVNNRNAPNRKHDNTTSAASARSTSAPRTNAPRHHNSTYYEPSEFTNSRAKGQNWQKKKDDTCVVS